LIHSMTAFGRSRREDPASGYAVTVEIRCLNGKNLDTVLRLPRNLLQFEDPLRKLVTGKLRRGRVEIYLQIEATRVELKASQLNFELAAFHWAQLQRLHRELNGADPPRLEHILRIPNVFESQEMTGDLSQLGALMLETAGEALHEVIKMRQLEGQALCGDCLKIMASLRADLAAITARKDSVVQDYQKRLRERIQELLGETPMDENRFVQEVATMADRMDINEEIVRLNSHFDQMENLISGTGAAEGRKLDFLAQEMHRETNTIGSKAGDLETLHAVVRMKNEIARLKEQIQNVE